MAPTMWRWTPLRDFIALSSLIEMAHHLERLSLENVATAQHEGAIGNEAVERIAHEGELEIAGESRVAQVRAHLAQAQVRSPSDPG